jgi:AAHS family 3-hydroxyphenylpropionic acid transporter
MNNSSAVTAPGSTNRLTIFLCVLAALCEGIDLQAPGGSRGHQRSIQTRCAAAGVVLQRKYAGTAFCALLGGRLSDTLGRKVVLVSSIAVFGLFSLLTAWAWDIQSLIWARLLTGVGLGGACRI